LSSGRGLNFSGNSHSLGRFSPRVKALSVKNNPEHAQPIGLQSQARLTLLKPFGCVVTASWAAYIKATETSHGVLIGKALRALPDESIGEALPIDSHVVPGTICSRPSVLAL